MGKIFAISDLHGVDLKLFQKVLDYLQTEDKLYIIGDVIDRGEYGIDLLEIIMKDPRCFLIKGNHEQMMINAQTNRATWGLWIQNSGKITEDAFYKRTKQEQEDIIDFLRELPTRWCYKRQDGKKIILEHAGFTPGWEGTYYHDPLWDRNHFIEPWKGDRDTYIVHGHTPVQYLKFEYDYFGKDIEKTTKEELEIKRQWYENGIIDWKPTIIRYCDGHKFDIDMGTISSQRIALLDLETFECKYFDK